DCSAASAGPSRGCVRLISGATGTEESTFLDASESGDDVFFLTSEALAAGDSDTSYDAWPYLQRLHRAYGAKAVHVVGVSQNDADSSRAYYADHGEATFDLLLDPEPTFAASNAFGVESVPHLRLLS